MWKNLVALFFVGLSTAGPRVVLADEISLLQAAANPSKFFKSAMPHMRRASAIVGKSLQKSSRSAFNMGGEAHSFVQGAFLNAGAKGLESGLINVMDGGLTSVAEKVLIDGTKAMEKAIYRSVSRGGVQTGGQVRSFANILKPGADAGAGLVSRNLQVSRHAAVNVRALLETEPGKTMKANFAKLAKTTILSGTILGETKQQVENVAIPNEFRYTMFPALQKEAEDMVPAGNDDVLQAVKGMSAHTLMFSLLHAAEAVDEVIVAIKDEGGDTEVTTEESDETDTAALPEQDKQIADKLEQEIVTGTEVTAVLGFTLKKVDNNLKAMTQTNMGLMVGPGVGAAALGSPLGWARAAVKDLTKG